MSLLEKFVTDGVADDILTGKRPSLTLMKCNVYAITEFEYWSFVNAFINIAMMKYHLAFNFTNSKKKRTKGQKRDCVDVAVNYDWTYDLEVRYFQRSATGEVLMGDEITTPPPPPKGEEDPL